ncbi:hypothetical protein RRG08_055869 [Elysia crispata]|uniref:Uncharacterized protein n=1 Tax=Elysia crispata TaxID=231223 RepID=A0AAE0ZX36_9GAST|nr:hypothetical protein RRG08_055869 [Elysia crispata]
MRGRGKGGVALCHDQCFRSNNPQCLIWIKTENSQGYKGRETVNIVTRKPVKLSPPTRSGLELNNWVHMMRWNICKKSLGFNTSGLMILTCILFSAQMTQSLSCIPSIYNSHFYTYCSDTRDRDTAEVSSECVAHFPLMCSNRPLLLKEC